MSCHSSMLPLDSGQPCLAPFPNFYPVLFLLFGSASSSVAQDQLCRGKKAHVLNWIGSVRTKTHTLSLSPCQILKHNWDHTFYWTDIKNSECLRMLNQMVQRKDELLGERNRSTMLSCFSSLGINILLFFFHAALRISQVQKEEQRLQQEIISFNFTATESGKIKIGHHSHSIEILKNWYQTVP